MTRAVELLLFAIAFVIVTLASAPAVAEPAKVALTIEGDSSSIGLRKAVVGAFNDDDNLEFVSAKQTTRVIERMGIGEVKSATQAKTVADRLDATAVVQGAFDESAKTLTLTIFNGKAKGSSFTLPAGDTKSATFRKAVRNKMLSRIAVAAADEQASEEDEEAPAKASKKTDAKQAKADAKQAKADAKQAKADAKQEKLAKEKLAKEEKAKEEKAAKEEKEEKAAKSKKAKESEDDEEVAASDSKSKTKDSKNAKDGGKDSKDKAASKTAAKDESKHAKSHDDDESDDERPSKVAKKDDADDKHAKVAAKDEEEDDADDEEEDEEDASADEEEPPGGASVRTSVATSGKAGANFAAIRVDLGASMMGRSLKFTSSAVEGAPASYRPKPQPGGHVAAEIYPAAVTNRSRVIAGLGVAGELDQSTSFTAPAADGSKLKVAERQYSIGMRFRIGIGHRATSPTVTLGAGYGVRSFAVDHSSGMATGVPDVDYRMIDPGLMLRVPVGRRIALFAGGRGLLLMSAGPIAEGDQYGRAHVKGGTATAGLDIVLNRYLAVRIAGEGTQLDMTFQGQGIMSANLDGDPTTIDVQRARDRYYGGQATLAVMY